MTLSGRIDYICGAYYFCRVLIPLLVDDPLRVILCSDIVKQWKWLSRLGYSLDRILIPSVYGGQETNFIDTYELNDFVNDLLIEDIKYYSEDWGEDADERSARILKTHNRNKALNQLGI